jgi:chromosome partitioning protein
LGALRETQLYLRSLERGTMIFDLPPSITATDLKQWEPILNWLKPLLFPLQAADDASQSESMTAVKPSPTTSVLTSVVKTDAPTTTHQVTPSRLGSSLPSSLMPAQESLVHGGRLTVLGSSRPSAAPVISSGKPALSRNVNLSGDLQIPQFLKHAPR